MPLVIAEQGSFFVGGRQVASNTLSTVPAYDSTGTITVEQMYVRYQKPVVPTAPSVTLIHGCCLTGKTWETTPDGRMGWDEYFVRNGRSVYIVDQVSRGRSASNPTAINSAKLGETTPDQLPDVFSAGQEAAWRIFRFGDRFPDAFPGMRFPIDAVDELWKQMVPDWAFSLPAPNPTVPALSELANRVDSTVLVSHSQSGIYPFQTMALSPEGIAGIVAIEPASCPDPTTDVRPYIGVPVLVIWGDNVNVSPRWAPRLEACQAFTEALRRAGGNSETILLPEIGVRGNSHMLMQDSNSLELADLVSDWIDRNIGKRSSNG